MPWTTILITIAIAILAIGYVVFPLFRTTKTPIPLSDDRLSGLMLRKETALNTIKELEFDYHTGKLNDEDYERLNQRLRRQAIGLLQRIEKIAPVASGLDAELEEAIAEHRQTSSATSANQNGVAENSTDQSAYAIVCPQCNHVLKPSDKFCAQCGTALS